MHAHAAGERRVDVERLLRGAAARLRRPMRQRAHIVQAVGELDQQHAHVVGDGEQKLAQVLGLLRLLGDEVELLQLGQALDQRADVGAEQAVDLGAGGVGILDGVVQERRGDGRVVELEIGEDRGDLERVREVRIAGGAHLLAMGAHGIDIGAVEQVLVGAGLYCLTRSISSYCRIIRGLRGFGAASASCGTRSGPCATATRGRGWFCIRGRSIGERAMKSSAPPRKSARADHKDIMTRAPRHKRRRSALPPGHRRRRLAKLSVNALPLPPPRARRCTWAERVCLAAPAGATMRASAGPPHISLSGKKGRIPHAADRDAWKHSYYIQILVDLECVAEMFAAASK